MSDTARGSRVGSVFGPYRLKRLLGRGGMGEVYEALDTIKDRVVALKLMSPEVSQDPVFRERMQREAHTAGRLQEPHVVPIHDFGEIDGQLYIDMRFIEGTDVGALLSRFGPLPPASAVAIVRQVASALDAAHSAGVMHRDIKPENILVTGEDFAYLVDFGIAAAATDVHLTQTGSAVGTWKYMAPERFGTGEVTYRADIYALACVLYECLTGLSPYRSNSAAVLVTGHLHEPIPRPSQARAGIPAAFDEVIARGMAKNPQDRYARAGDLGLAAHQALSTPDQDRAVSILDRSQLAGVPPSAPGSPDAAPFAPTAHGFPDAAAFTPGVPGFSNAAPFAPGGGGWSGYPGTPQAPQPTPGPMAPPGGPPAWTPPAAVSRPGSGNRNLWIILGAAALVIVAGIAAIGAWLILDRSPASPSGTTAAPPKTTSTSEPPPVPAAKLDSILASADQVNAAMRASTMQPVRTMHATNNTAFTLSNPDCTGTLFPVISSVYANSGYSAVTWQELHEPDADYDHVVDQAVVAFPSAALARQFVQTSTPIWTGCAGHTITVTADSQTLHWTFGNVTGAFPTITQVHSTTDSVGGSCQHVMSTVSNVVVEVDACAATLTDEGNQIANTLMANAKNAAR